MRPIAGMIMSWESFKNRIEGIPIPFNLHSELSKSIKSIDKIINVIGEK